MAAGWRARCEGGSLRCRGGWVVGRAKMFVATMLKQMVGFEIDTEKNLALVTTKC